jgi:hypothetical protein
MANTYTLIEAKTLGSDTASMSFTSIPATYTDLLLLTSVRINRAGVSVNMNLQFNGSSSNYTNLTLYSDGTTVDSLASSALVGFGYWYSPGNGATADTFSNASVYISNYTSSEYKPISIDSTSENNGTDTNLIAFTGVWQNAAAITSIALSNYQGSNLRQNSTAYLYGIKNS